MASQSGFKINDIYDMRSNSCILYRNNPLSRIF